MANILTMADSSQTPAEVEKKPVHTLILDASPLLLNTPGISTLLANGHVLVTTPSVLAEIRGEEARNRIDTLYRPFLTIRTPKPESVKFVKDFARRTGDAAVLSTTDFEVLAVAYEIECERNGGDWRLRKVPGQKRVNGAPPQKPEEDAQQKTAQTSSAADEEDTLDKVQEQKDDLAEKVEAMCLDPSEDPEQEQDEQPMEPGEVDPATGTTTS